MSGQTLFLKKTAHISAVLLAGVTLLSSCGYEERRNLNKTVTIQSNAYYIAVRDGSAGAWEVLIPENSASRLNARSMIIEDPGGNYSVMLACDTRSENSPSKVYLFNANLADIRSLDHVCRKPAAERIETVMYGGIKGVDSTRNEMAVLSFARAELEECQQAPGCDSDTARVRNTEGFAVKTADGVRDVLGYKGTYNVGTDNVQQSVFYVSRHVNFSSTVEQRDVSFEDRIAGTGAGLVDNVAISYVPSSTPASILWSNEGGFSGSLKAAVRFVSTGNNVLPLAETTPGTPTRLDFLPVPAYRYTNASADPNNPVPVNSGSAYIESDEGHEFLLEITDAGHSAVTRQIVDFFPSMVPNESRQIVWPQKIVGTALNPMSVLADNKASYALPAVGWDGYYDAGYGAGQVYYTILTGTSTLTQPAAEFPRLSTGLEWHVISTRQSDWLRTSSARYIPEPAKASSLKARWMFKKATPVSVVGYAYTSPQKAEGIVAYIMDASYTPELSFASATVTHADVTPQ